MNVIQRTDKLMADLFGEDAFRVGGSVRDEILGRKGKDADYVVRNHDLASLMRVLARVAKPILIKDRAGNKLGFRVRPKGLPEIEVVVPRTEVKVDTGAGNERHNFRIDLDPKLPLEQDALRRDFTFNAIYRHVATGAIFDPLDGMGDMAANDVVTTHVNSFRDDPLRILRALRFVSTFGFRLSNDARAQMAAHAPAMGGGLTDKGVSGTVLDEFNKLLMGDNVAEALRVARDTGALVQIFPELEPLIGYDQNNDHHSLTGDEHTFLALDVAAKMNLSLRVRWSLLFHDAGKPLVAWIDENGQTRYFAIPKKDEERIVAAGGTVTADQRQEHGAVSAKLARKALNRLNAEKKLIRDVTTLNERHMVPLSMKIKPTKIRTWRAEIGDDLLADLFKHRIADAMAKKEGVPYSDLEAIARMEQIREDAVRDNVPASAKDMKDLGLINGHDLIEMGVAPQEISSVLAQILHEVISQPSRMDRNWALLRAAKLGGVA
jgi:tRNA nucleotidyltransferase (CCA-adding enzyme)